MVEKIDGRVKERASRRSFVGRNRLLRTVLTANLVILMGLAVISFSLPLSEFERWFVVSVATILAAVDLAAVERLRTR